MSDKIKASVKPALLEWARKSVRLSLVKAASLTSYTVEQLKAWEKGDDSLTISELRILASVYQRPISVFFLSKPPMGYRVVKAAKSF